MMAEPDFEDKSQPKEFLLVVYSFTTIPVWPRRRSSGKIPERKQKKRGLFGHASFV